VKLREIPLLSTSCHGSHLREFKDDKLGFLRRVVRECGPIARARILGTDVVVVSGPEVVHEILVTRARAFEKAASTRLILYPLAGEGLFTSRNPATYERVRREGEALARSASDAPDLRALGTSLRVFKGSADVQPRPRLFTAR
jgi:hypothetical protein